MMCAPDVSGTCQMWISALATADCWVASAWKRPTSLSCPPWRLTTVIWPTPICGTLFLIARSTADTLGKKFPDTRWAAPQGLRGQSWALVVFSGFVLRVDLSQFSLPISFKAIPCNLFLLQSYLQKPNPSQINLIKKCQKYHFFIASLWSESDSLIMISDFECTKIATNPLMPKWYFCIYVLYLGCKV